MIRHVILLLLSLLSVADLNAVEGSLFSDVISIDTVCDVDFMTCPNGGRAFRDRSHDCAFTPCEFIPPAPPTPTPTAIDPSTENATWWFGNEEFFVPTIRFRELKRGKCVFKQMLRLIQRKTNDSRSWIQEGSFATSADIYHVAPEQNTPKQRTLGRSTNSQAICDMLRSVAGDENESKKVLEVSTKPWSLYAFFGCHELQTSVEAVHTALDLLHKALNLSAYQVMNISGAPTATLIGNRTQQNSIPTIVLENDVDISTHSPAWLFQLSVDVQSKLCAFLETLLVRLRLAHDVPIDNQDAQLPHNDSRPISRSIIVSSGSAQKSTASVAVFFNSMPELLQADDGVDVTTVWNFTMLSCDSVAIKSIEAQQNVIYRPLVNSSLNSTADAASNWNIDGSALKANATSTSYVCSCWMYHDVRDAAALAAQRLTYCH